MLVGDEETRLKLLACFLMTLCALGVQISWKTGQRAMQLAWIGVLFTLDVGRGRLVVEIPEKVTSEILAQAKEIQGLTVVKYDTLRSFAGRLSWVARVLPRTRWAVSVLFGVVADTDRESMKPKKQRSRSNRAGLVHTKRMALAILFIVSF